MEAQFTCSTCGNAVFVDANIAHAQCEQCGHRYELAGHLCPQCYTYHDERSVVCHKCGESTSRLCPNCNAVNWPGNDDCTQCGVSLDIFEYIVQNTPQGRRDRLRGQMRGASYFKEVEEKGSRKRMAEFMAMEEERQHELQHQRSIQRKQERTMLIVFLVGTAIILSAVVVFTLLN
jgi:hypothetical protein